jgi:hypothetical protein
LTVISAAAAPPPVVGLRHDACFNWVLVNVPGDGEEVVHGFHILAFETVLKEMAGCFVLPVIVVGIAYTEPFQHDWNAFAAFFDQKTDMIPHQAPAIEFQSRFCLIFLQDIKEFDTIFLIIKDFLPVRTPLQSRDTHHCCFSFWHAWPSDSPTYKILVIDHPAIFPRQRYKRCPRQIAK